MPSLLLRPIYNFLGLSTIAHSKLVLHDAIFLATCLATLEKEIHCKLQKICYTLQFRAATQCCGSKKKSAQSLQKVEPSSTLCNLCKPKNARQVAKMAGYMLATKFEKKISPCNTSCRARLYFLHQHFETVTRLQPEITACFFFNSLQVAVRDCNL